MDDEELARAVERRVLSYAPILGSLSVLAGALITAPLPNPWWLPAWFETSFVLCTASGYALAYLYERTMDRLGG